MEANQVLMPMLELRPSTMEDSVEAEVNQLPTPTPKLNPLTKVDSEDQEVSAVNLVSEEDTVDMDINLLSVETKVDSVVQEVSEDNLDSVDKGVEFPEALHLPQPLHPHQPSETDSEEAEANLTPTLMPEPQTSAVKL